MGLSVGIVGLPNVGKSTTFNALSRSASAAAANYPFCTIEPNRAVAPVPDARLAALAQIVQPNKIVHSAVEFVDIAGLVRGASKGEGLGNKFLSNIRETDLILHVVRCFADENITHVEGGVSPLRDVEIIQTELILADIEQLGKKLERLVREAKSGAKGAKEACELANELLAHLNDGRDAASFGRELSNSNLAKFERFCALNKELRLLSAKEVIYAANVDESALAGGNDYVAQLAEFAAQSGHEVVKICAKLEEELVGLSDDEARELLAELGVAQSGLDQLVRMAFNKLNLISYFTAGVVEVRAWTIGRGWRAPKAASVIHNDFERGFIRAEVISYEDFVACGGEARAKEAGKMRLEGKDYVVADGDVMHFRFNV